MSKFLPPGKLAISMGVKITYLIEARVLVDQVGPRRRSPRHIKSQGDSMRQSASSNSSTRGQPERFRRSGSGLGDLLLSDGDYDGVIEVTASARNENDFDDALVHMRAAALFTQGHQTAALDAFKVALARTANEIRLARRDPVRQGIGVRRYGPRRRKPTLSGCTPG